MALINRLKLEIRDRYGCEAAHLETVKVREERSGRILWEGEVEVFSLQGHQRARRCFAWLHSGEGGKTRYVIILAEGHIDTARDAVRAAMVNESRRQGE